MKQIDKPCLLISPIRRLSKISRFLVLVGLFAVIHSKGFAFSSGSDGSDGALDFSTPGTILFDPVALGLDSDGDNVYHFTTINIAPGVTVKLSGRKINGPVFWLAQGDVTIAGTVDLDGEDGIGASPTPYANPASRIPAYPGPGGYPGGVGAYDANNPAQDGGGPGGGKGNLSTGNGGGAGFGTSYGGCPNGLAGGTYGNNFIVPLIGGSGGGGGGRTQTTGCQGVGGGGGGGAILIASSTSITLQTNASSIRSIVARGGGNGGGNCGGSGGWGSGGSVRIAAPNVTLAGGAPVIEVEHQYFNVSCSNGQDTLGGAGRIRIEALQLSISTPNGTVRGPVTYGSPFNLYLPTQQPDLVALSVDGVPVASSPNGDFNFPDTTINNPSPVTVDIAAKFIPLATIVKLYVYSENGDDQIINSTPLTGTLASSTATATVTLPSGFSRGFLRAVWTP